MWRSPTITSVEEEVWRWLRIPTNRWPTHPGEMLREKFQDPLGITQRELADAVHVPYQRVNEIVNRRRGITPSTASASPSTLETRLVSG